MGAQAGIGSFYNILPRHFVGIHRAVGENDLGSGRKLQREVNQVIRICQGYGGLAALRTILAWQGVDCGNPVPPTRPLDEEEKTSLRRELGASGVSILE
jgi:N-acetylneuraminate lyase